ncbi:hypothetical protein [Phyllobacterium chamaecytisi]|uniref:hypothetical protein n=1 Tax=Phyllobacterium chamaecytisi TaxID=2876082 RepID=UPI001CCAF4F0|nr:hypothetical protein [Phyllobacterium sp. KW56]MBZ9600707.1 hypothetical protein [Phyllobacterium sp. KW56]
MNRALLTGVTLGVILSSMFLSGCANGFVYETASLMDANDKCMEQHVWSTTGQGYGVQIENCMTVGWYAERRVLDAKAGAK